MKLFPGNNLLQPAAEPTPFPVVEGTPTRAYFDKLNDILRGVEVSTGDGAPLELESATELAVALLIEAARAHRKVLLIGNGGSAAVVGHVQVDLMKAARIPALVFTEAPLLTAFANDDGYDKAFDGMASVWVERGDVLWAVSSSGRSPNIVNAARTCAARGATVMTMTGFAPDNPLRALGHLNFYARNDAYGLVELAHGCLAHYVTDRLVHTIEGKTR